MFEKYILVNPERYKATVKQSMSTGKIFFEFSAVAGSKKELLKEVESILYGLTKIANEYNKEQEKKSKKEPEVKVKGLK